MVKVDEGPAGVKNNLLRMKSLEHNRTLMKVMNVYFDTLSLQMNNS